MKSGYFFQEMSCLNEKAAQPKLHLTRLHLTTLSCSKSAAPIFGSSSFSPVESAKMFQTAELSQSLRLGKSGD
jgi:hypothetical protein